jgi:hypothetical protein
VAKEAEAPLGVFPVKKRKERRPDQVAARVAKLHRAAVPTCQESQDDRPKAVQPLNQGFFALERMRTRSVESKKRTKKRVKAKSK